MRVHALQFGDMHGWGGLWHAGLAELRRKVGVTPKEQGAGTANTALVCHAGKLLALHEGDLPYAVRPCSVLSLITVQDSSGAYLCLQRLS